MNPDTTSPINSKIGNVHICLPQNLRLDNSQVTTGIVIQPNGSYKLRKYPIWLKYSPIVSYIHLSYLDAFGYNIDLIFVKPELYSNNPSAINYVARKVLISHNELNSEYHQSLGPFDEIFLLDNDKKLNLDDYIKIMCIIHVVPSMDWIPSDDIITAFNLDESESIWLQLADSSNKEYHEIWNSRGLTLNNHDNEYYDLADSLIKQFEDFCNDPDIVKLNDQINNAVIDGGERANDSSSDDKEKDPLTKKLLAIPKLIESERSNATEMVPLPKLLRQPTHYDSSGLPILNTNASNVAAKLNNKNPLNLNRKQRRGLSKKTNK